jgi:hypothetical protein
MDIKKMLDAVERLTPEDGFNLVGVDTFKALGDDEELFLVGHYDTEEAAEAEKAARLAKDPDAVLHIYSKE